MRIPIFTFLFIFFPVLIKSQSILPENLPDSIWSGKQGKLHVQGCVVDQKRGFIYFSFTDKLVKTDLDGNFVGSVTGFAGHLGDLTYDPQNDKVYASLEYKNDVIGKGIHNSLGLNHDYNIGFYIAAFDCSAITMPEMKADQSDVLKTIYLKEVVDDYLAEIEVNGRFLKHRFACSGIDGIAIAPDIENLGKKKKYIYVAYGIYGDTARDDNDYQVILKYDISKIDKYGRSLDQKNPHKNGPAKPVEKYLLKTGNTTYGIQNLEFDPDTQCFYAAVYAGKKTNYPNYTLFLIDGLAKPVKKKIVMYGSNQNMKLLSLHPSGLLDDNTGIRGWRFPWGATGLFPVGGGYFYISHPMKDSDGLQSTMLYKYRRTGRSDTIFEFVGD